jgi:hypothetical protein
MLRERPRSWEVIVPNKANAREDMGGKDSASGRRGLFPLFIPRTRLHWANRRAVAVATLVAPVRSTAFTWVGPVFSA